MLDTLYTLNAAPTLDTNAYATGDLMGTLLTFSLPPGYHGGVALQTITLTDLAKQSAALDVVLFSSNLSGSTLTDNAAFDPDDADLPTFLGAVNVPAANYAAFNDSSAATVKDIHLFLPSAVTLYAVLVSRGTPTYAASSLRVYLTVERR